MTYIRDKDGVDAGFKPTEPRDWHGRWSQGEERPTMKTPSKSKYAYKQFELRNGELYATQAPDPRPIPIGRWIAAESHVRSDRADRPGFYGLPLPMAPQLRSKGGNLQPNRVWAKVKLAADPIESDRLQKLAESNPKGDIRHDVPGPGYYEHVEGQKKWWISGGMYVVKVLSDEEVFEILSEAGLSSNAKAEQHARDAGFKPSEPRDWHGRWSRFAEEAQKAYLTKHPKTHAETVELLNEFNEWIEDAKYFVNERDWYARHKELAIKLFRDKEPIFEKVMAATSINEEVPANVHNAVLAMEYYLTHNDSFKGYGRGMKLVKEKLNEITELGEVVGPKITPFSKNLQGDWEAVTVDRWMRRLFFKNPILKGGKRSEVQNEIVRNAVVSMAKSLGWKPAELQAVLWNVSRYHGGVFNFSLEDFNKYLVKEADGVRAFLDTHGIAHDAAPMSEATVALAKMFLKLLDMAVTLFGKLAEKEYDDEDHEFEVAKDGSSYDAGFDPTEPRDWHGRWTEGFHGSHTSASAYAAAKGEMKASPHFILSAIDELPNHVTISKLDDLSDDLYREAKKRFGATDTELELATPEFNSKIQAATQGIIAAFDDLQKAGLYKPGDAKDVKFIFADMDERVKGLAMMTGHDGPSDTDDWIINTNGLDFAVKKIRQNDIVNFPQAMALKFLRENPNATDEDILRVYYKGCMEHEYAHFLDSTMSGMYSRMLLDTLYEKILHMPYGYHAIEPEEIGKVVYAIHMDISDYAKAVIPEETFAEGFCRWLNDPYLPPYLKDFYDNHFPHRAKIKQAVQQAMREFSPLAKDGAPKAYFEPYPNPKYLDKNGNVIPDKRFAEATKDAAPHAAGLALIAPDGNMLFVKRDNHGDFPGHWAFPGGKINPGETPEQAAERETIEEIGHVSNGPYEVAVVTGGFQTFVSPVRSVFTPQWLQEHSDYKWSLASYPPEPLHPGVREALKKMQMTVDEKPTKEEGRWVTIHGQHIFIRKGEYITVSKSGHVTTHKQGEETSKEKTSAKSSTKTPAKSEEKTKENVFYHGTSAKFQAAIEKEGLVAKFSDVSKMGMIIHKEDFTDPEVIKHRMNSVFMTKRPESAVFFAHMAGGNDSVVLEITLPKSELAKVKADELDQKIGGIPSFRLEGGVKPENIKVIPIEEFAKQHGVDLKHTKKYLAHTHDSEQVTIYLVPFNNKTTDAGYSSAEPRDWHGRWTKGGVAKGQLELPLGNEPEEDDWRVNQLNEEDVDDFVDSNVRMAIDSNFPNMSNYEVVGPPNCDYNCIAWAFGFEDKWWNPGAYSTEEVDEVLVRDYNADFYRGSLFKLKKIIDEKPAKGHVKLALFEEDDGQFCHMTRQLPDGRWTSKWGSNGKTAQRDLTDMEGGEYGHIARVYDMPIKEFSRFRKDHQDRTHSSDWL